MKKILPLLFVFLVACGTTNERRTTTESTVNQFFDLYKQRTNWQSFQDLYSEDLVFEDVIFRYTYDKEQFVNFYNWPDALLKKHPDYPEVMVLEDLTFTDSTAVGRGYFTPFYYGDALYNDTTHMRFVMALEIDRQGKIKRHTDFIEYPAEFMLGAAQKALADSLQTR